MEVEAVLQMRTSRPKGSGLKPRADREDYCPSVVRTVATNGTGVTDLLNRVWNHRAYLEETGGLQRRRAESARQEIVELIENRLP